ncbi:MAG: thermonuclease family protein [Dehalococcoidia bacterium]
MPTAGRRASVFGALLLIISCAPSGTGGTNAPTPTAPAARDLRIEQRENGGWYADLGNRVPLSPVVRVVDGDTLIVTTSSGGTERIRVFGIQAPEVDERCGTEATNELTRLAGASVRLIDDERTEDQFGRALRYVFTEDDRSIDAELVRQGAARAWRDDGAFRDILVALETNARREGAGCLWSG